MKQPYMPVARTCVLLHVTGQQIYVYYYQLKVPCHHWPVTDHTTINLFKNVYHAAHISCKNLVNNDRSLNINMLLHRFQLQVLCQHWQVTELCCHTISCKYLIINRSLKLLFCSFVFTISFTNLAVYYLFTLMVSTPFWQ